MKELLVEISTQHDISYTPNFISISNGCISGCKKNPNLGYYLGYCSKELHDERIASYSNLDSIDFGVYITTTQAFQKYLMTKGLKWNGSLTYEKVIKYLPHIRSAIQVPIYVIGIDI